MNHRLLVAVAALSLFAYGCRCGGGTTDAKPVYVAAPKALNFEACPTKDEMGKPVSDVFPDEKKVTITNQSKGTGAFKVTFTGDGAASFTTDLKKATPADPTGLSGVNDKVEMPVYFTPTKKGVAKAQLVVSDEVDETPDVKVDLSGNGSDPASQPESSVNRVGVEVNTASARLLAYVSGIGEALAKAIVAWRAQHGAFASRKQLMEVPRLGAKAFEQAAGILRIRGGTHPLDASAVHPESYDVVERMAADLGVAVSGLVGQKELLARLQLGKYVDERRGEPTLRDIVAELERPGRDPREGFEAVGFRDDVTEISHLQECMVLQGVVTNVAAFGAFVDVGVHQGPDSSRRAVHTREATA